MTPRLVIFGTGDLVRRYLLPALARLEEAGRLPDDLEIRAVGRDPGDDEGFRGRVRAALAEHARGVDPAGREAVAGRITYRGADATDPDEVARVVEPGRGPVVAYLALPPAVFAPVIEALERVGLPEGSRIAIEKPFGDDLASARSLNRLLHEGFEESAVFRIDHFLAMQTVQNVLALRCANRVFAGVWNREHIDRVEIVWDETLTLEGRASYYDRAGALKDMIQNHLLQLLCMVAMEPPRTLGERAFRDAKTALLRAVRPPDPDGSVRGRYTSGLIGDRSVPAYVEEEGVDPTRGTETFAQLTVGVDAPRWEGVAFVLRSGKALARARQQVVVTFRDVNPGFCDPPRPNVLRLPLAPERMVLEVNLNDGGAGSGLADAALAHDLVPPALPPYALLLLAVLQGDAALSIRDDEAEESWRIVEPVLAGWAADRVPLLDYPAGSDGPVSN